ncbi:hypothetical protein TWF281_004897 [Arthrobotrys megalospora]
MMIRGNAASLAILEGFFPNAQNPNRGSTYTVCYGAKDLGHVVSLVDNSKTTCEGLRGLSFWMAREEQPTGNMNRDFQYFSLQTVSGDYVTEDPRGIYLQVGPEGDSPRSKRAV